MATRCQERRARVAERRLGAIRGVRAEFVVQELALWSLGALGTTRPPREPRAAAPLHQPA